MKRVLLPLAAAFTISSGAVCAQTSKTGSAMSRPDIDIIINGHAVDYTEGAPAKEAGRVLVPFRSILKSLPGFVLVWDSSAQTVTASYGDRIVRLTIGSREAKVNGSTVALDAPATTMDGRTMVPLRFLSEALGAVVNWNNIDQRVTVVLPTGNTSLQSVASSAPTSRRFFRSQPTQLKPGGVKFNSTKAPTDVEELATIEERTKQDYSQWSADRTAWMADYSAFLQWQNLQLTFNSMYVINGSSGYNGQPANAFIPGDSAGRVRWQAQLQTDVQRDAFDQKRFNADYQAYVQAFKRVHPGEKPIAKPAPP